MQSSLNENEKALENARKVYEYRKNKFGEDVDSTYIAKKLIEEIENKM